MTTADKSARLRLLVDVVTNTAAMNQLVSQARSIASQVQAAMQGVSGVVNGKNGIFGPINPAEPFLKMREQVTLTRAELEKFYTTEATKMGLALGRDIANPANVATGRLADLYSKIMGVDVAVKQAEPHMAALNRMFALQNLAQAAGYLKQFGEYLGKVVGEGMADSLDKEGALVRAVEGVLINNPDVAAKVREGGAQAYKAFSEGLQAQLNAKAIEIGLNTTFSDNQVAQGMSILLKSGVDLQDVLGDENGGVADAMAKIAMISGSDIPTAAKHMISVYNQFGDSLKAQFGGDVPAAFNHVADVITNALGSSGVDLNAFMNSLSYAGTASALAGQSFGDTAAVLTLFAQNGVAGSKAGTGLRRIITNLTPTTDAAAEAIAAMTRELGGSADIFYDAQGNMKSLTEVQAIMAQTLATFAPQDQIRLVKEIFGQYAIGQALILANADEFGNLAAQVNQAGTAQRQVNAIMESGVGINDRFKEATNTLKETIGETNLGYVNPLKQNLSELIERYLTQAPKSTQEFVASLIGGTAILAQFGGGALQAGANLGVMALSLNMAGISLGAVAATAGTVVAVIAAIAIGAYLLYEAWTNNFGGIQEHVASVWAYIGPTLTTLGTTVVETLVGAVQEVKRWWDEIYPSLSAAFDNILAFLGYFAPIWQAWWDGFMGVATAIWNAITGVIQGAWEIISGIFSFFTHLLSGEWGKLWDDLKRIFEGWKQVFAAAFQGVWDVIVAVLGSFWNAITDMFSKIWTSVSETFSGWFEPFAAGFSAAWDRVTAVFRLVGQVVRGDWSGALDSVATITGTKKETILAAVRSVITGITSYFTGLIDTAKNWGANLIGMFVDGIKSKISAVTDAVRSVADNVKGFLGFASPTKFGPASNSDEWAPNFVNMFADGITKTRPALQAALNGMAMDMQVGVAGAGVVPGGHGGRGQTIVYATFQYSGGSRGEFDKFARDVQRVIGSANGN